SMASIIVAHELTHALDDQHFGIDRLIDAAGSDSEKSGGVAAVVEGSGTLVMTMFTVREMIAGRLTAEGTKEIQESEAGQAKVLKTTPQVVQRILVGPYMLGMRFLLRGDIAAIPKDVAPKADLDHAFHDPAASGWGGDLWQHYRRGDDSVTVLATVWDTRKDAREFDAALPASPGRAVFAKGDAVVVVAGAAGDRASKVGREALRAARSSPG